MKARLFVAMVCGVGATVAAQTAPPQPPPGAFQPPSGAAKQAPGARPAAAGTEGAAPPAALPFEAWRFNPRERTARGIAAWNGEKPAEAVEALDTAARLRPADPLAAFNSGTAHLGAGLADAGSILERALRDVPAELATDAHYNLGNARLAGQDAAGAIDSFRETLRRSPGHPGARRNLELALRLLEEQQRQQQQQQQQQDPSQDNSSGQDPQPNQQRKPVAGEDDDGQDPQGESQPNEGEKPQDGSPRQQPGSGTQRDRPLPQFEDQQDMTAEQAAAILQAVDNLEREKRRDEAKQRALAKTAVEKDW